MYTNSRRYGKNDWWDLVTVIDQELAKKTDFETYFYIVDELKWRIVDSLSEGANYKIRNKAKEVQTNFEENCTDLDNLSELQRNDIYALFDFVISTKDQRF